MADNSPWCSTEHHNGTAAEQETGVAVGDVAHHHLGRAQRGRGACLWPSSCWELLMMLVSMSLNRAVYGCLWYLVSLNMVYGC